MTAPSTDELIARLRQAANGSGGAGGPRCLQTAAADRLETLRKAAEGMADALRDYEEAIREHIATEFPHSAWIPVNLKEAIDQGDAVLAEHRKLKP